jgi:hypothetical protein
VEVCIELTSYLSCLPHHANSHDEHQTLLLLMCTTTHCMWLYAYKHMHTHTHTHTLSFFLFCATSRPLPVHNYYAQSPYSSVRHELILSRQPISITTDSVDWWACRNTTTTIHHSRLLSLSLSLSLVAQAPTLGFLVADVYFAMCL